MVSNEMKYKLGRVCPNQFIKMKLYIHDEVHHLWILFQSFEVNSDRFDLFWKIYFSMYINNHADLQY